MLDLDQPPADGDLPEASPPTQPELPASDVTAAPPTFEIGPADLERFGLQDCAPGREYTATIRFRVPDSAAPPGNESGGLPDVTDVPEPGEAGEGKQFEIADLSGVQPAGEPGSEGIASLLDADGAGQDRRDRGAPPKVDMKAMRFGSV